MSFLLKSKPKSENRFKFIIVILLFLFLLLLSFIFSGAIRNLTYFVARPIWTVRDLTANSLRTFGNYFVSKNQLYKQNLALEDEVSALQLRVIDYDALQKQNEELKNQLGRINNSSFVISRVLSKPPQSPYDTLVIDVGSGDGFATGDKVYLSDNIIIGTITDITIHNSLVTLFSAGGQKLEAVNSRTGTSFSIVGQGGANFKVEVPKDADVIWGDIFGYPALTTSVIGSVYYIDNNPQSSFKTVYIRTPGNVFESKWVFVEKSQ